jgi:hypothetical protein
MRLTLTLTFLLFASSVAFAQTPKATATPEGKTNLETFQAKTGAVIIKGFTRQGSIRGVGGTVEVSNREFIDAQTGKKAYGVVVEVKESGRLERSNRSFIDYDEIDSLLKGIDYIAKIDSTVTKLKNFEAQYTTKGEFSVTVFNDAEGLQVAITSGRFGGVSMYLKLEELVNFRKLITDAKAGLDEIRQATP